MEKGLDEYICKVFQPETPEAEAWVKNYEVPPVADPEITPAREADPEITPAREDVTPARKRCKIAAKPCKLY